MQQRQTGFTLIELITVIVILGALSVVALPRFLDLQDEAERAAAEGVAGALGAASALNFAAEIAGTGSATTTTVDLNADPATGSTLASLLQNPNDLADFAITACDLTGVTEGDSQLCELQEAGGTSFSPVVEFTVIGVD